MKAVICLVTLFWSAAIDGFAGSAAERVSMPVRVVDAAGRAVAGLKPAEFQVIENGVTARVVAVSEAEVPLDYGLVVDTSADRRAQLEAMIESGKAIVGAGADRDEGFLISFAGPDATTLELGSTAVKARLTSFLDNLFAERGPPPVRDALFLAAQYLSGKPAGAPGARRALVLFTDGTDRSSATSVEELRAELRKAGAQVFVVGVAGGAGPPAVGAMEFMRDIAAETGGSVLLARSAEEIVRTGTQIAAELRRQYVVSYEVTGGARDGSWRPVEIRIADGPGGAKRTAIAARGRIGAEIAASAGQ